MLFKKKFSIDKICVSPIPSKSTKLVNIFFLVFKSNNLANSFIEPKKLAKIFAFSCPMCLIPMEKINLSRAIDFDLLIAFLRLFIESSPHPSRLTIFLKSNLKISEGSRINFNSQNWSTTFFPSPSMLSASLETICLSFSFAIYSQS